MPSEIERKYLVTGEAWRGQALDRTLIEQAYLGADPSMVVRVRLANRKAWLTIKGKKQGATAPEFEYPIPPSHAREMIERLPLVGRLTKIRRRIRHKRRIWEVDEFLGDHAGLVLAEIELKNERDRPELPDWVGLEVTQDSRYANCNLARQPGCTLNILSDVRKRTKNKAKKTRKDAHV
ncbi:MAG: CYTH domain-containing protein [Kiritimatiellia bacterium]|nr:CYTH domain-containing protein [Kiritimatiellia bacterium]